MVQKYLQKDLELYRLSVPAKQNDLLSNPTRSIHESHLEAVISSIPHKTAEKSKWEET